MILLAYFYPSICLSKGNNARCTRVKKENLDEWLRHDIRIMDLNLFTSPLLDFWTFHGESVRRVGEKLGKGEKKVVRFNRTDGVRERGQRRHCASNFYKDPRDWPLCENWGAYASRELRRWKKMVKRVSRS